VGSANFDWRSLAQVKELGVLATDCPDLALDVGKIWDVYWKLGGQGKRIPGRWPSKLATQINSQRPLNILDKGENVTQEVYLATSPREFAPR